MRYVLATFFVAGMYFLVGCGGSQQQESTTQTTEQTTTPPAEPQPAPEGENLPPMPADTAAQKN
ncbi:MAG: hypothetical protein ACUVRD_00940 [Bacteroidia bacterium]